MTIKAQEPTPFWRMGGVKYPYATPRLWNERDIETPWGVHILKRAADRILEVGNVMHQVQEDLPHRTIVDRWDPSPNEFHRADIVDWDDGPYDLILSLSTLEHVGTDPQEEQDPYKAIRAVQRCVDLLADGGELAFTIPCGYHTGLVEYVLSHYWTDLRVMGRQWRFARDWHELGREAADCAFPHEWHSARRVLFVRYRKQ